MPLYIITGVGTYYRSTIDKTYDHIGKYSHISLIFRLLAQAGKKTLFSSAFNQLKASTSYVFMRLVSTRSEPHTRSTNSEEPQQAHRSNSPAYKKDTVVNENAIWVPKEEVDSNIEVALSEKDFMAHKGTVQWACICHIYF